LSQSNTQFQQQSQNNNNNLPFGPNDQFLEHQKPVEQIRQPTQQPLNNGMGQTSNDGMMNNGNPNNDNNVYNGMPSNGMMNSGNQNNEMMPSNGMNMLLPAPQQTVMPPAMAPMQQQTMVPQALPPMQQQTIMSNPSGQQRPMTRPQFMQNKMRTLGLKLNQD